MTTGTCRRCREPRGDINPNDGLCNDCGADLFDEWRADQAVAEHDAAVEAGLVNDTPDPDNVWF
jgi:hypothetical protein